MLRGFHCISFYSFFVFRTNIYIYIYIYIYQCCGHYKGITINYHCNYLGIKALRLPLPLQISTKVINYHCNYISTIAITIINYKFILGCLPKLLHLTKMSYICGDLNRVIDVILPFPPGTRLTVAQKIAPNWQTSTFLGTNISTDINSIHQSSCMVIV